MADKSAAVVEEAPDPIFVPAISQPPYGVDSAFRALPTTKNVVEQPAHYQHVYIESSSKNAGSIQTITLRDAVDHNVLASSDLQVKRLSKVDTGGLNWVVLDKGNVTPSPLEGVAGANATPITFAEVNFDLNLTEIINPQKLLPLVQLASRVGGIFYVVGYADESGIESKNITLADARAKSVRSALVDAGINPTRIFANGAGISRIYPGLDLNRRTSISFKVVDQ